MTPLTPEEERAITVAALIGATEDHGRRLDALAADAAGQRADIDGQMPRSFHRGLVVGFGLGWIAATLAIFVLVAIS